MDLEIHRLGSTYLNNIVNNVNERSTTIRTTRALKNKNSEIKTLTAKLLSEKSFFDT